MSISRTLDHLVEYFDDFTTRRGFDDIAVTLGLVPHAADGESLSFRMSLSDAIAQAGGMYSAAALFGAADITGTVLAMQAYADSGSFPLAVQSSQNFLTNSRSESVVATARLLRSGGRVAVVEASVVDTEGERLMHATFTYVVTPRGGGR